VLSPAYPGGGRVNVARRLTVLVVDDEASILRWLARSLDAYGYATLEAADAEDALRCLESNRIEAAIFDVRMPGGRSGLELLEELREHPDHNGLPVILLTGIRLTESQAARVNALGATVFYKPSRVEPLVERLDQALGKKRV
jgi:DNA-binding response OmpR family regulator